MPAARHIPLTARLSVATPCSVAGLPGDEQPHQFGISRKASIEDLSHTRVERQLYRAMLSEVLTAQTNIGVFSARTLMLLTGLTDDGAVRRGLRGLVKKRSIEHLHTAGDKTSSVSGGLYLVYTPDEIIARRSPSSIASSPEEARTGGNSAFRASFIEGFVRDKHLTRREAEVAMACAEGLCNADIGKKLRISELTVKYHLRHVFSKLDIKRRAELILLLLAPAASA